jgi:hypothetical protein
LAHRSAGTGDCRRFVVQFALRNAEFFCTHQCYLHFRETRDEQDLGERLQSNTLKHLEMFNAQAIATDAQSARNADARSC